MEHSPLPAGTCHHCRTACRRTTGAQVWPSRADLAMKVVWVCDCGARVGSHPNGKPLGTAANEELRRAREKIHARIDPVWQQAFRLPVYQEARETKDEGERRKRLAKIRLSARSRVYRFIADRMGLTKDEMHVAMFGLDQCRAAWVATRGLDYAAVREWAQANPDLNITTEQP